MMDRRVARVEAINSMVILDDGEAQAADDADRAGGVAQVVDADVFDMGAFPVAGLRSR